MMEGKPRSVHVDHLRPLVDEQEESNNVTDDQATINVTPGMGDQDGIEQVPIISPENTEATAVPHTRRSQRQQKPTKRLIEPYCKTQLIFVIVVVYSIFIIYVPPKFYFSGEECCMCT